MLLSLYVRGACEEGRGREVFVSKKKKALDLLFQVSNDNMLGFGL